MRNIVISHTNYKNFGGEDSNFLEETKILSEKFSVFKLQFSNREKINLFDIFGFFTNSNFKSNNKFKEILNSSQIDLFYVHNLWFKGNLKLLKIANKQNIQTVVKIHNFRYLCANSYFSDNHVKKNQICNACGYKGRGVFKFNKYFSNSFFKSFLVIWHTKKMLKMLNQYPIKILLISNQHIQDIKKHVSNNKNLYKIYNPISISRNLNKYNHKSDYVVYAGRVTSEKGIFDLIDNWKQFKKENMELRILGEVEQKLSLDIKNFEKDIKIYGYIDLDKTLEQISNARALILPTLLYEGQPRVLCEAAALGVPSIFPNFGSLKELFSDDYLLKYRQFNNLDFMSKLNLLHDEKIMIDSSEMVLRFSKEYFSKEVIVKKFIEIVNDK